MFDSVAVPSPEVLGGLGPAELVDVMSGSLRLERAAAACKVFAAAEVFLRGEAAAEGIDRECWRIDGFDAAAAQVAAAQGVSRHKAAAQMRLGVCLREDLPQLGAVFAEGLVDYWVVDLIASRVSLLEAADMARIDAALAGSVSRWNRLSRKKVVAMVDSWVVQLDVLAKRRTRSRDDDRCIEFGECHEGISEVWGAVRATAAAAMSGRLDALAATVCANDPRTVVQRRADAIEALAAGADRMVCGCGGEDCAAGVVPAASPVVVHVVADAQTVHGGAGIPGFVSGFGALPADLVRAYVPVAQLRDVALPEALAECEAGYRPSEKLATYVKLRDVTCRFPGCQAPAAVCDVDHTVPWPYGPTHVSNLKLLCRHHHLVKTFYGGTGGWCEVQQSDGTVVWTAPTGHQYVTRPTGTLFFPQLGAATAKLTAVKPVPPQAVDRGVMMPNRIRTRAEDKQARIAYERARNHQEQLQRPPPEPQPPPF